MQQISICTHGKKTPQSAASASASAPTALYKVLTQCTFLDFIVWVSDTKVTSQWKKCLCQMSAFEEPRIIEYPL